MVERNLPKVDVAGSSPVIRSISSIHNGLELWILDFLLFSRGFLCTEQVRMSLLRTAYFCAVLLCRGDLRDVFDGYALTGVGFDVVLVLWQFG